MSGIDKETMCKWLSQEIIDAANMAHDDERRARDLLAQAVSLLRRCLITDDVAFSIPLYEIEQFVDDYDKGLE